MDIFRWFRRFVVLGLGVALLAASLGAGIVLERHRVEPLFKLTTRAEMGWIKLWGGDPMQTASRVGMVETAFFDLSGQIVELPGDRWRTGGGLTVWGDDLVHVNHDGTVSRLSKEMVLAPLDIDVPPNGADDYREVARRPEYSELTHELYGLRYNDIQYVNSASLQGLVLSYSFFDVENLCYGNRLAWLPVAVGARADDVSARTEDWKIVFETRPCLDFNTDYIALHGRMAGARMAFRAPGTIYVTVGDFHLDGIHGYDSGIQSDESDYGKVIAIDLETGHARHLSKGHRNAQGITLDREGRLWMVEHGMRGGDELNLIEDGGNYGWPLETLGTLYSGMPFEGPSGIGRHDVYVPPVHAWVPSVAPSSLMSIDGFDPAWDGDLLLGALKGKPDIGQALFRIRLDGERVSYVERIPLGNRVRYVTQWHDKIAVLLDFGQLVIFTKVPRKDRVAQMVEAAPDIVGADRVQDLSGILTRCAECHSYEPGKHDAAPSLFGVVGRPIASTAFSGYSAALSGLSGGWSADRLVDFLESPETYAPGTTMAGQGLSNPELTEALVRLLGELPDLAGF